MEPSKKAPGMERFLQRTFQRTTKIRANVCTFCNEPATEFKDELSRREYTISGLCQKCQDETFNSPEV